MIKTDITLNIGYATDDIKAAIAEKLPVRPDEIRELSIIRRTLDIGDTTRPRYKTTVAFTLGEERDRGLLKMRNKVGEYCPTELLLTPISVKSPLSPVVVGFGPAGLFAALYLAECGLSPIVLERGSAVEERVKKVSLFNTLGILDPDSNVQFGEGGAGTFSDGKLKVGSMDKYKNKVLSEFILAGADPEIAYSSSAHLGTDTLPGIVRVIREKIISLGGRVIFDARFVGYTEKEGRVSSVKYMKDGVEEEIETSSVILAIGHSARDTVRYLYNRGIVMSPRGFGVGMRVEHPREYINGIVYKEAKALIPETASYHLVTHLASGRSVYSFCMCPGGTVVAATGEQGAIVTNGMSEHSRMGDNSNAAILVSVTPKDFGSDSALAGIDFQERIERKAFSLTDNYVAPATSLGSLVKGIDTELSVKPSYPRGVAMVSPSEYLPDYVTDSLKQGFLDFDEWLHGFYLSGAALTGPETRTTSPVRILRLENGESPSLGGIYPTGEGAGYSGGIVSSAVDGLRMAEQLVLSLDRTPC